MTALTHKSVKLPVHRVYLGKSTEPCVRQAGVCVLTGRGSNSLTIDFRTAKGFRRWSKENGGKRKWRGARPWS